MKTTGILLAAGAAQRFGGGKLLADAGFGEPMCVTAYRHLRAVLDEVIAVVRPGDAAVQQALAAAGATLAVCANAHEGMAASLACGVQAAAPGGAYLVALADMPFIHGGTIGRIAQSLHDGALIAAPTYQGERGHPVGFAAALHDELRNCRGDAGARDVLKAHANALQLIAVDDPGVLRDIDTQAQLQALRATSAGEQSAYKS